MLYRCSGGGDDNVFMIPIGVSHMESRYGARNDVEDEVKATTLPADATGASKGINGLISV